MSRLCVCIHRTASRLVANLQEVNGKQHLYPCPSWDTTPWRVVCFCARADRQFKSKSDNSCYTLYTNLYYIISVIYNLDYIRLIKHSFNAWGYNQVKK